MHVEEPHTILQRRGSIFCSCGVFRRLAFVILGFLTQFCQFHGEFVIVSIEKENQYSYYNHDINKNIFWVTVHNGSRVSDKKKNAANYQDTLHYKQNSMLFLLIHHFLLTQQLGKTRILLTLQPSH